MLHVSLMWRVHLKPNYWAITLFWRLSWQALNSLLMQSQFFLAYFLRSF